MKMKWVLYAKVNVTENTPPLKIVCVILAREEKMRIVKFNTETILSSELGHQQNCNITSQSDTISALVYFATCYHPAQ